MQHLCHRIHVQWQRQPRLIPRFAPPAAIEVQVPGLLADHLAGQLAPSAGSAKTGGWPASEITAELKAVSSC